MKKAIAQGAKIAAYIPLIIFWCGGVVQVLQLVASLAAQAPKLGEPVVEQA